MNIKRYDIEDQWLGGSDTHLNVKEDPEGEWVKAEDVLDPMESPHVYLWIAYCDKKQECELLQDQLSKLKDVGIWLHDNHKDVFDEYVKLETSRYDTVFGGKPKT